VKEGGFTYLEALLSIALFAIFVLTVQEALHITVRERTESTWETKGYLLAYSLIEQWKARLAVDTNERIIEGKTYQVRMTVAQVTEMVEKCEVRVSWESEWLGKRYIGFTGYRFTPALPTVRSVIIGD
jgi:Tfp pilus assembly protein PilV